MDDTILSRRPRARRHVAVPNSARPPGLRASCSCHGFPPAAWRGDGRHDLPRARRPHRATKRLGRPHVQLPRHRHVGGRLLDRRLARTTSAPRSTLLHARADVTACGSWASASAARSRVRSGRRRPRARRRDDRGAGTLRDWARDPPVPRARPLDGRVPHAGLPVRRDAWVRDDRRGRRGRGREAPDRARSSCCTGRGRRRAGRRRPRARRRRARARPSCGSCQRRGPPACATIPARSPRCSAGSTARCRAGPPSRLLSPARLVAGRVEHGGEGVVERRCSGCQPVVAHELGRCRRRGAGPRPARTRSGSVTTRSGSPGPGEQAVGESPTPRRAPSRRCRPRPARRARRAGGRRARRRARR